MRLRERVPRRDRARGLHRLGAHPVPARGAADHVVGAREVGARPRRSRSCAGTRRCCRACRAPAGRRGVHRRDRVDDRREHLVVDVDQRAGVLGDVAARRRDRGDRLAGEAHAARRRSRAGGRARRRSAVIGSISSAASAPVRTATTPGSAFARDVSIERMRAFACGLRRTAPWSIPVTVTSPTYCARPVRSLGSSLRGTLLPTQRSSWSALGSGPTGCFDGAHAATPSVRVVAVPWLAATRGPAAQTALTMF